MEYARLQKLSAFGAPHVFSLKHLTKKKKVPRISASTSYLHTLLSQQGANRGKTAHSAAHPQRPNAGQTEQDTGMQAFLPLAHKHGDAKLLLRRVASETSMDSQPCGIPQMLAEKQGAAIFIFQ